MCFSPSGHTLRAAVVAWISVARHLQNKNKEAKKRAAWRECDRGNLAPNPCIHAGSREPVVRNNAAWDEAKSMEKHWISTVFLGFCAYFA